MSLTRVDCHYYVPSQSELGTSAFVVLNPVSRPGAVVAAGSTALRDNIGSQVACKLAIEHFVSSVLGNFDPAAGQPQVNEIQDGDSVKVLEEAFKLANSSVYSFGHKLAAAGRMGATLIGLVIAGRSVAVARAGEGAAFLLRQGQVFPFFEEKKRAETAEQAQEQLVGAHSLVSVELASVPIDAGDVVLLLSRVPSEAQQRRLSVVLKGMSVSDGNPSETLVRRVFDDDTLPHFTLLVRIGPEAIYLHKPII
jgi:hypothetical protein